MNQELLKKLEPVTLEEAQILSGNERVQKELYTSSDEFLIDSSMMIEKGKLINVRKHTRFIAFPEHRHNYIEIIYMCKGSTTHIINKDAKVVLKQGELLFLNQFSCHEIQPAKEGDIGINFIILPEFFEEVLPMVNKRNILSDFLVGTLCRATGGAGYLHYAVSDVLPIQNLVENLIWTLLNKQMNSRQINQATMGLLFMHLINSTDKIQQDSSDQEQDVLIMQMLQYIEENYKTAALGELSRNMKQSPSNLSKIIKKGTGKNFKQLLQEKRLKQAEELLRKTTLPVTEIIYRMGYDNTSYFHRIFRKSYDMSPRAYRERNKQ